MKERFRVVHNDREFGWNRAFIQDTKDETEVSGLYWAEDDAKAAHANEIVAVLNLIAESLESWPSRQ